MFHSDARAGPRIRCTVASHGRGRPWLSPAWAAVFLMTCLGFLSAAAEAAYLYRKKVTIQGSQVSGSLTNFPVLVSIDSDDSLRSTANGGRVTSNSGFDITFRDSNGTTVLAHEIELYTASTGRLVAWVRVPDLTASNNREIFIYYGNSTVTSATQNPPGVWDGNFSAVWHMAEDPSVTTDGRCGGGTRHLCDSTGNNNHGVMNGAMTSGQRIAGRVGNAWHFNPEVNGWEHNDWVNVDNSASLNITGNQVTLEAWVWQPAGVSPPSDAPILNKGPGTNAERYMLGVQVGTERINQRVTTSVTHHRYDTGSYLPYGTWHQVIMVYNGSKASDPRIEVYKNGALHTSNNASGTLLSDTNPLHIAKRNGGDNRFFRGYLDELRISNIARSQDWIATQYRNHNSPSTFHTIGAEESIGGPASYQVTSAASASTCVAQSVTIRARDSLGNTFTSYTGTVNLSTSTASGGWAASGTSGPVVENANLNDGVASYTFRAADNGQVTLLLTNQAASNLTVTAVDSVNVATTGVSGSIGFRDNAFVIEEDLSSVVAGTGTAVAGRPHDMRVTLWRRDTAQVPANCQVASAYTGLRSLKAWLSLDASHPAGATAPGVSAAAPGVGLATVPAAVPGANNLQLNFVAGQATFNLTSSDVGKYALNLRDDSRSFANAVDVSGASVTLTVQPFAIRVTNVSKGGSANPGGSATSGSRFVAAGDTFSATVGGYLWSSADDANNDGLPDANTTNVTDNGLAPRFAGPVTLSAGSTASSFFSPAGGVLGALTGTVNVTSGYTNGAATVADLRYAEVGSMELSASLTNYLGTAGVNLSGWAVNASGQPISVGRFYPFDFSLLAGATVTPACGGASGFTYKDQPAMGVSFTIEARNALGVRTQNYRSGSYAVGSVSMVAENNDAGVNLAGRLSGVPVASWSTGSYAVSASSVSFTRVASPDGPYENLVLGVVVTDSDTPTLASRDMNATTAGACGGGCNARALNSGSPAKVRFGRLRVSNAMGAPQLQLPLMLMTEYWTSTGFVRNNNDSCTVLTNTNFTFAGYTAPLAACNTSGTPAGANAITFTQGAATGFRLTAPNQRGSVDLTLNLGASAAGNSCSGGASVAATAAGRPWLQGNWGGSASWNANPTARIGFGMYGTAQDIIYRREVY